MDHIWSPWRYRYLASIPSSACVFCEKASANQDEANLIVHRAAHNFVLLNLFPYTSGHLLIAPYQHTASLEDTRPEILSEMIALTRRAEILLRSLYRAQGINLGMNLGECAGAGVAGHIHMHVLPRWPGDANFMSTIGETRVLPEELSETRRKLATGWEP